MSPATNKENPMRSFLDKALLAVAALAMATQALANDPYPTKPVRVIVPFPPGGATDTIVRIVAQKLSDRYSQQFVVENKPGGGTVIASDLAAKAAPDGYTLLVVTAAFAVNPSLQKKLPYDTGKDFVPVTLMSSAPNVLVTHPSVPAANARELIDYAKANPGKLNYASAGNGSSNHLAGEMFRTMAGVNIVHVPYKGDAPSITDLLGGQVQVLFIGLAPVAQHISSGKLKAIAVTSAAPTTLVPGVAPLANTVPGFDSHVWNGLLAPAKTPAAIVNALQAEIAKILAQPETREKILGMGFEPAGSSPAQFQSFLEREIQRSAKVVSHAGIKLD
jgi:tripartite-type tricarboxylate transporter receptor subunit TctC